MGVAVGCYGNRKKDEARCSVWGCIDVMGRYMYVGMCKYVPVRTLDSFGEKQNNPTLHDAEDT